MYIITFVFPLIVMTLYLITGIALMMKGEHVKGGIWVCYAVATALLALDQAR